MTLVIAPYFFSFEVTHNQVVGANLLEPETVGLHQKCLLARDTGRDMAEDMITVALDG
jgi:hypothetical protein